MRLSADARYGRFLRQQIIGLFMTVGEDRRVREDDDPRIKRVARIDDDQIDQHATGSVVVEFEFSERQPDQFTRTRTPRTTEAL